ncbi:MAG TPA: hypothetical protein VGF45_00730 [Polyangia bacterium]
MPALRLAACILHPQIKLSCYLFSCSMKSRHVVLRLLTAILASVSFSCLTLRAEPLPDNGSTQPSGGDASPPVDVPGSTAGAPGNDARLGDSLGEGGAGGAGGATGAGGIRDAPIERPDALATEAGSEIRPRLSVSTIGLAATLGTVVVDPRGLDCGQGCLSYQPGQQVTVTALPTPPALFAAWGGDCAGQGHVCTITMMSDKAVAAHFRPNMNLMFVTSQAPLIPGRIGANLDAADAACSAAAKAAFLGGTNWRAWLATSSTTAAAHVGSSTTGWIRVDGRPFAASSDDLIRGKVLHPPSLTERKTHRSDDLYSVLTGAQADGRVDSVHNCDDWTNTTGPIKAGNAFGTTDRWSSALVIAQSCGSPYPIYCFQNDPGMASVTISSPPTNARRAFVTATTWRPEGGIAGADMRCQSEARTAALPNPSNYRALLATGVPATDSSRLNLGGQPWYRLDGVQLVASAADLNAPLGNMMLTTLSVDANGQYVGSDEIWTGNGRAPGSALETLNCNNWSSNGDNDMGWWGYANILHSYMNRPLFWANLPASCSAPRRLYCFEN